MLMENNSGRIGINKFLTKKQTTHFDRECLFKTTAVKYIYRGSEIDLTKSVEVFHLPGGKHILCIISVV